MVTAIQADPEVAFGKLPSIEFFMFILLPYDQANQAKRHYKLSIMIELSRILFLHFGLQNHAYIVYQNMNFIHLLLSQMANF